MWLAGRIVCNSRARPASKFIRECRVLNRPGHGTSFGKHHVSEGYLQSKDLQRDLFSIFVFRIGVRRKWRSFERKTHTIARFGAQRQMWGQPLSAVRRAQLDSLSAALLLSLPKRVQTVEIIWKSCGMRRLTGFYAATYACQVSRTVGFALVASSPGLNSRRLGGPRFGL